MFGKRMTLAVMVMMAATIGCQTPGSEPKGELVAKVNGQGIAKADFDATVERNMARYRGKGHKLPPGIEQRIRESVLRRLIDDKVVALKGEELGVVVSDTELDTKFSEHKARFRTEEAFQDYLRRSNNTEANMKKDLRRNLLRDQVVEKMSGTIEISDEDVQAYYDANIKRFIQKEQIKASRVLIRVSPKATDAEKAAAKKKARSVRKSIQKLDTTFKKASAKAKEGELEAVKTKFSADFKAIAKEHSNAPEAGRGGDLGWLSRGRMPPEFDKAAFGAEAGGLTAVVQTRLGFEIIKVWEKKPERQRPFEEVSSNIRNSLTARKRNEKRRSVLKELKGSAKVEQLIKFDKPGVMANPVTPGAKHLPGHAHKKELKLGPKIPHKGPVKKANQRLQLKPGKKADKE